jgi:hypothetical protein
MQELFLLRATIEALASLSNACAAGMSGSGEHSANAGASIMPA